VGSLAQLYKGTDVLIEAVARCLTTGLDLTLVIAGDGKFRTQLMRQAERQGVDSRVRFLGHVVSGEPIRRVLDNADVFVLPSRTEGLPRALIEAMARALPCIGSAVGGVPELLDESDLVAPGDPDALARKIQEVLHDPMRMEAMSRRNLAVSREYVDHVLAARRRQFYHHVLASTQRWEVGHQPRRCGSFTS
jgi:glycosyltransferase involved in cell wall biosynthesis